MDKVTVTISLVLALSVASERLVEILKGLVPWLDKNKTLQDGDKDKNERLEGWRRAALQLITVFCCTFTAFLSRDFIPPEISKSLGNELSWFGLGLLASGGSGFWNATLTYVTKVKELKSIQVIDQKPQ